MTTKLKSKEENPNGLYRKYNITRTDGKPIPESAEFFILRLDIDADHNHRFASLRAIEKYAYTIEPHLPELSKDIREKYLPWLIKSKN